MTEFIFKSTGLFYVAFLLGLGWHLGEAFARWLV